MKRILTALLLTIASAFPAAAVDSVTGTPATISIPDTGNALITIRWRVTFSDSVRVGRTTVTVRGAEGISSAGKINTTSISETFSYTGPGSKTVTIIDRIRVDRATAQAIQAAGTARFTRVFTNSVNGDTETGAVTLQPGTNASLGFREFDLSFDNKSRYKSVGVGEALTARVDISSTGTGRLQGTWEVSGPDAGTFFRVVDRQTVALSGNRRVTLESPNLPTDRTGIYLVRFLPDGRQSSVPNESYLTIRYVVTGEAEAPALALVGPLSGSRLDSTTEFSWAPVSGAAGYRIEFVLPGIISSKRLAGKDITGTSARLSPLSLRKLTGRGDVSWRVIAYDGDGREIAQSSSRKIGTN